MYMRPPGDSYKWKGFPVQLDASEINFIYIERVRSLIFDALREHSRWSVIRFDLHVPEGGLLCHGSISSFIDSIRSQLLAASSASRAKGRRGHDPMLRYLWVREMSASGCAHYHVALLLNRDAYYGLGDYARLHDACANYSDMLAGRICKAWGVALNLGWKDAMRGVHFPRRPVMSLLRDSEMLADQIFAAFYRLSYFAKLRTKVCEAGWRNFGMSQRRCI